MLFFTFWMQLGSWVYFLVFKNVFHFMIFWFQSNFLHSFSIFLFLTLIFSHFYRFWRRSYARFVLYLVLRSWNNLLLFSAFYLIMVFENIGCLQNNNFRPSFWWCRFDFCFWGYSLFSRSLFASMWLLNFTPLWFIFCLPSDYSFCNDKLFYILADTVGSILEYWT
jgi:hypothetical protein